MPESLTEIATKNDDTNPNYLDHLVGEGKKYRDAEDLARAYAHADRHINELRDDNDTLRAEKVDYQELVEQLRTPNGDSEAAPVAPAPTTEVASQAPVQPGVSPEDVAQIVKSTITQEKQDEIYTTNESTTLDKLAEVYGSREAGFAAIRQVVQAKPELKSIIDETAKVDPDSAVKFITGAVPAVSPQPNTPGIDNRVQAPNNTGGEGHLSWSEARKVRRENPSLYHSPEFRERLRASEDFYAGKNIDYYNET